MISLFDGSLVVALHNVEPPVPQEWSEMMAGVRAIPLKELKVLVFTDGGGPDAIMRGELTDYTAGQHPKIAVLSESLKVRGILTAISWFNRNIKQFAPTTPQNAFDFLSLGREDAKRLVRTSLTASEGLAEGVPQTLLTVSRIVESGAA